jgi:hypothetical protein
MPRRMHLHTKCEFLRGLSLRPNEDALLDSMLTIAGKFLDSIV